MTTVEMLNAQLEPYKNTLVIGDFFKIVLLLDLAHDEFDHYWVYETNRGIVWSSCVGSFIPLKGFIPEKDYERMVMVWNLNYQHKAQ